MEVGAQERAFPTQPNLNLWLTSPLQTSKVCIHWLFNAAHVIKNDCYALKIDLIDSNLRFSYLIISSCEASSE